MKKFTITILAIIMAFTFAACSSDKTDQNPIAELYANEEYTAGATSCGDGEWKGVFYNEDYSDVKLVVAKMTDEETEAYDAVDFVADDAEEQQLAIIFKLQDVTVTDISDKVPTQEDLEATWVGKKCGDFEDAGFYNSGNTCDENDPSSLELYYDGPDYCVAVGFGKNFKKTLDELSPKDIRGLKVASIRMTGIGDSFIY